jgi:hypothetical protein
MDQSELIDAIKKLTKEIEKNNSSIISTHEETVFKKRDFLYFLKRYIQEILEAMMGLLAVMLILKREFVFYEFLKVAMIIGSVTLILEEYNMAAADTFKQGIYFTIGAVAFSG